MRNRFRGIGVLVVLASLGTSAMAQCNQDCCTQPSPERRIISVYGTAAITADADMAVIRVQSRVFGQDAKSAAMNSEEASSAILLALSTAGVPKSSIEYTSPVVGRSQTYELQPYPMGTEEHARHQYNVVQAWIVRVKPDLATSALKTAIDAGASENAWIQWTVENAAGLQAKASADAIANARAIAEQIAEKSGLRLGHVVSVDAMQDSAYRSSNSSLALAFGMGDVVMSLAQNGGGSQIPIVNTRRVEFRSTVRVAFSIEDDPQLAK